MDEPTYGEMIRDIQVDVRYVRESLDKTVSREVYDLHQAAVERRLTALENGKQELKRWAATAVAAPILVALIVWLIIGGRP